jgi:uncharacterized phage-associated protein
MKEIPSSNLSPFDVANWFICHIDREAGDSITHLKLQKLIYYAQAWALALKGCSIFEEDFEAWTHGPVIPRVYEQFRHFGFESIPVCDCENPITEELEEILLEVQRVYGEKSAKSLELLTHQEAPWLAARDGLPLEARCNAVISKESMTAYYQSLLS